MKITGNLDIRKDGTKHWILLSRIEYDTDYGAVTLLPGFRCDGGSVPRAVWSVLGVPRVGTDADWGFFCHDGLYSKHRDSNALVAVNREWSRKEADKAMHDIHLHCGLDHPTAEAIFRAVRLGASWSWMTEAERKASRPSYDGSFLDL